MRIGIARYQAVDFFTLVSKSTKKRNKQVALKIDVLKAHIHCEGYSVGVDIIDECESIAIEVCISDLRRLKNILLALEEQLIIFRVIEGVFCRELKLDIGFNAMLLT